MKTSTITSALMITIAATLPVSAAGPAKSSESSPNLMETTAWIAEFAPNRLAYSTLQAGPFSVPGLGLHEVNQVESIVFSECAVLIKKFEDRVLIQFENEKGGMTQYSKKEWVSYSFSLGGTETTLDLDDENEAKPRGYHLLKIRFKPGCENSGNCPRFAIRKYEGEGENQRIKSSKVIDGGIYFESSKTNADALPRLVNAFNHAAKLCSNSKKRTPF